MFGYGVVMTATERPDEAEEVVSDVLEPKRMPKPGWSSQDRGWVIKVTKHWIVMVVPMIFNDRIVIANHEEYGRFFTAGWCYDKGLPAKLAALAFDPETQVTPVGFKKQAYDLRDGALL